MFGYRKTNVLGLGITLLNNYFTLRYDAGLFNTIDEDESIERPYNGPLKDPVTGGPYYDRDTLSYPIQENATYLVIYRRFSFFIFFRSWYFFSSSQSE